MIILTPFYYRLISPPQPQQKAPVPAAASEPDTDSLVIHREEPERAPDTALLEDQPSPKQVGAPVELQNEISIQIETELYYLTLSNRSGGSFIHYSLKNYLSSYGDDGAYQDDLPVSLIQPDDTACKPCLAYYDIDDEDYNYFNAPFDSQYFDGQSFRIAPGDSLTLEFNYTGKTGVVLNKKITLFGDSYKTRHQYSLQNAETVYRKNIELSWIGGLLPTEKIEVADSRNSAGIIYQSGQMDDIKLSKDKEIGRKKFEGNTDWIAIKNKYFIVAMLPDKSGVYGTLSAHNIEFGKRKLTPIYNGSIGYSGAETNVSSTIYLGPQDYKLLQKTGVDLEDAMNWGIKVIRPISKYIILTSLTFLHKPFNLFTVNYGVVLILFAFLVRFITGPLTKKSYRSTKKMQAIQPKIKAVQAKYKSDPQRMNREVMALYKKHGVNPVGGCLPMLIQMPLLFALFVVFRNTIEFRGAEFIFWITDLSQPDIIYHLPFSIPIYGSGVAILPLFMGITMFFQQRLSMATMEKSQKPMMYMMTGFFFLLFNQFPSGLNLYYAVYNILNIIQQRSIRAD
ncbi:MAG: membrane protein insertase YidC [FCB group bacterium]|nr:membrane protein insertase YidC [FCB group bacterium]